MSTDDVDVFTEFVQTMDQSLTAIPTKVRNKLTRNLKRSLNTRGLLRCPAYLFNLPGETLGETEPFEALLMDAFVHLFYGIGKDGAGKQFRYLKDRVARGECIDRLIQMRLKCFVHDLHRNAYPLSAGIHKNVIKAAQQLDADSSVKAKLLDNGSSAIPNSESLFGLSETRNSSVGQIELEEAIKISNTWHQVLGIVGKSSKSAVAGVCKGILELIELGKEPFLLGHLESAIDAHDFQPAANISTGETVEVYSRGDTELKELVRTIDDDDRYERRQEKVDEFRACARKVILGLDCSEKVKSTMLKVLECIVAQARGYEVHHIGTTDIAAVLGMPKQTCNDYVQRIKSALEKQPC